MKFIYETQSPIQLTFQDVEEDQFFVDIHGCLSQKVAKNKYNCITNDSGDLCADHYIDVSINQKIERILPKVTKIEF